MNISHPGLYGEITVKAQLKQTFSLQLMHRKLSDAMNYVMRHHSQLSALHRAKGYKHYSFSGLRAETPLKQGKYFGEGQCVTFQIRFPLGITEEVAWLWRNISLTLMDVQQVSWKAQQWTEPIQVLHTLTPVICTLPSPHSVPPIYWRVGQHDIVVLKDAIEKNATKKYNHASGVQKEHQPFIEEIVLMNRTPILYDYRKGATFLGNKCRITIKQDGLSQQIAKQMLLSGALEKNSLGFGFCRVEH